MQLSGDSTCAYHLCDQNGHSVCDKVYSHYTRLVAAVNSLLEHPDTVIPEGHGAELRRIIAENPSTITTT